MSPLEQQSPTYSHSQVCVCVTYSPVGSVVQDYISCGHFGGVSDHCIFAVIKIKQATKQKTVISPSLPETHWFLYVAVQ